MAVALYLDRGDRLRAEYAITRAAVDPLPDAEPLQFRVGDGDWETITPDDAEANPAVYGQWFTYDSSTGDIGAHPANTKVIVATQLVWMRPATGDARDVEPVAWIVPSG